jgi:hypothetical protein
MLVGARQWAGLLAVLAVGLLAAATSAAADVPSAEIVRLLSLQREANGIPGALLHNVE